MAQKTKPVAGLVEKIAKECVEASASTWDVTKIVKELSKEETRDIEVLREKAIKLLEQLNPKAATIYASFHRLQVHTSKHEIEPFDRGNIIKSLLKETNVTRAIAEKIGSEVEDKIKDLKISYLTTALIREMVNVKLLEYGYEGIRNQYTRLGMPVFEAGKKIEKGFFENEEILTEYNLTHVLPNEISRMYFLGDIYIADLPYFNQKPFSSFIRPRRYKSENELLVEILRAANALNRIHSLPCSVDSLNIHLSQFVKGKKSQQEAVELFSKVLQGSNSTIGLDLFVPDELDDLGKHKNVAFDLANRFLQSSGQLGFKILVDSKYRLKLLDDKFFEKRLVVLNCKNKQLAPLSGSFFSEQRGILCYNALNMIKISLKNRGKESAFFNELVEKISALKDLVEFKKELLQKRAYLRETNVDLEALQPALGISALMAASRAFLDEVREREVENFAEKIFDAVRKETEGWLICEFRGKEGLQRFRNANAKMGYEGRHLDATGQYKKSSLLKNYNRLYAARDKKGLNELVESGAALVKLH